jgi:hypothetical protein
MIAWLLTVAFALAGIAFRVQGGIPHAFLIGTGCLIMAGLACPFLWARGTGLFEVLGVTAKDRLMACLALLLATPLLLPWPFWV